MEAPILTQKVSLLKQYGKMRKNTKDGITYQNTPIE